MDKKESFKVFAKKHPELITYLNNHSNMSWQKLYEIYDIYGEDESTWEPYFTKSNTNISDVLSNIDTSKMQEHIKTAQKALGLLQDLTSKGADNINSIKGPTIPRPLTKFFGD
ncbi:MAG: hypothetical protein IJ572_05140 [Bacilli bacterium]|nr:hypothetical protein [Bacilli bacterium]